MTKPPSKAKRADDWTFNMPAGLVTHGPTGIVFRMFPHWHQKFDDLNNPPIPWRTVNLEGKPVFFFGHAILADDVRDRRQIAQVARDDANAPGLRDWIIVAPEDAVQAAVDDLALQHGPAVARQVLERLARDAGHGWIFRARLERGWTDGKRAT